MTRPIGVVATRLSELVGTSRPGVCRSEVLEVDEAVKVDLQLGVAETGLLAQLAARETTAGLGVGDDGAEQSPCRRGELVGRCREHGVTEPLCQRDVGHRRLSVAQGAPGNL